MCDKQALHGKRICPWCGKPGARKKDIGIDGQEHYYHGKCIREAKQKAAHL